MASLLRSLLVAAALPVVAASNCSQTPGLQGWSVERTLAWYTASQGSRLIPQSWIHALEQPDGTGKFLDPAYVASFRYLPSPLPADKSQACALDPALPLGFTVDCQSDGAFKSTGLRWKSGQADNEPWVGMNCSACHTSELTYNGATIRIEGGPTLADFQSFTEALDRAQQNTLADPAKFQRFAAEILGAGASPADLTMLRAALTARVKWNTDLARLNGDPKLDRNPIAYGFGRLDAIGHIFNKVALTALPDDAIDQVANPSDAPVSYPFLWNVPQQDRVEWDGLAQNQPPGQPGSPTGITFDVGALGRNTGEVIGVFGDILIQSHPGLGGYTSSIRVDRLTEMEAQIGTLLPPAWPKQFPPIDQKLAQTGAALFHTWQCDACHTVPAIPTSLTERYTVALTPIFPDLANPTWKDIKSKPVGTDMWMACNTALDQARSGAFKGTKESIVSGTIFADNSYNAGLVKNAVTGALLGNKGELVAAELTGIFGLDRGLPPVFLAAQGPNAKENRRQACLDMKETTTPPLRVYKGRPLQGIWATAPYLHNGSVPTLYDLLLPPDQRPASFYTGTREFDPERVGYRTDQSPTNSFLFQTHDAQNHPIDGNDNAGHDYGNSKLSPDDRKALVEYMKTL
jgi:hypothetical protein